MVVPHNNDNNDEDGKVNSSMVWQRFKKKLAVIDESEVKKRKVWKLMLFQQLDMTTLSFISQVLENDDNDDHDDSPQQDASNNTKRAYQPRKPNV